MTKLKDSLDIIEENLVCSSSFDSDFKNSPCQYKYHFLKSDQLDLPQIIGYITINQNSGQYILKDDSVQIDILLKKNIAFTNNSVVRLKKWIAVKEYFSVGNHQWTYQYIIIQDLNFLNTNDEKVEPDLIHSDTKCRHSIFIVYHKSNVKFIFSLQ